MIVKFSSTLAPLFRKYQFQICFVVTSAANVLWLMPMEFSATEVAMLSELLASPKAKSSPEDPYGQVQERALHVMETVSSPDISVSSPMSETPSVASPPSVLSPVSKLFSEANETTAVHINNDGVPDPSSTARPATGRICRYHGCSKAVQKNGLCHRHGGKRTCKVPGCEKKDRGPGYCVQHGGGKRCSISGCVRSVRKASRCRFHAKESTAAAAASKNFV